MYFLLSSSWNQIVWPLPTICKTKLNMLCMHFKWNFFSLLSDLNLMNLSITMLWLCYVPEIPGFSSEGTRSLVQYSLSPNFWLGCYPPVDCVFCLILFIIVVQIGVPHYINHIRNGLLCLGETTLMSCLDSCGHLRLCIWSLHKYYEKLVPFCNWRLCPLVFVITNLDSKPHDWERVGQVCPEGHHILN